MNLNALPLNQRKLWARLAGVEFVRSFYLAGGTAVAAHLGHRESLDFDFFRKESFEPIEPASNLSSAGTVTSQSQGKGSFVGTLDGIKISFFVYPYPLLASPTACEGIQVADLSDIAAMKILAIGQRGSKKDFIDLHAILKSGWNLEAVFRSVERKYTETGYNKVHFLKSLTYFADAEEDPMPVMRSPISWGTIKSDLLAAVKTSLNIV